MAKEKETARPLQSTLNVHTSVLKVSHQAMPLKVFILYHMGLGVGGGSFMSQTITKW